MHTKKDLSESTAQATVASKLGRAVAYLGNDMERGIEDDTHISAIRIRAPRDMDDEYLLVAYRVNEEGEPQVAFHSASSFGEVVVGFAARLRNGTAKWNVDQYANGKG